MASPAARVSGGDQSVHVVSGVAVLPALVWRRTSVPGGAAPSHERRPQVETVSVSFTFDRKVPSAASVASRAKRRAGFDVTTAAPSPGVRARPVTCSAGRVATSVQRPSSPTR